MEGVRSAFSRFATAVTEITGNAATFLIALGVVVAWAVTGPLFRFSRGWQFAITAGTTIVTFLMVFLIQHAQNKDSRAVQMKLDELIGSIDKASNRLIGAEHRTDTALDRMDARAPEHVRR